MDINDLECPQICPAACHYDQKIQKGEQDARGCPTDDSCVPACIGGDGCCNENNKCDVGEGDCDSDDDCMEGLKCGSDNCLSARWFWDENWDSYDDCCYKPDANRK